MKMGPVGCPETSVRNYHYSLRNGPEELSSQPLRSGSLNFCPVTSRNTQTYKRRQKGARLFRCAICTNCLTERNHPFSSPHTTAARTKRQSRQYQFNGQNVWTLAQWYTASHHIVFLISQRSPPSRRTSRDFFPNFRAEQFSIALQ